MSTPLVLNLRSLCGLLALLMLTASVSMAQPVSNHGNKFEQLDQLLPAPNPYRSADGAPGPDYWQQRCDYDIECTLDVENQRLDGEELITYYNQSPHTLRYLWLQLDENQHSPENDNQYFDPNAINPTMSAAQLAGLEPAEDKEKYGHKIQEVTTANGDPLRYTINQTMMRIDLPQALKPGETFSFRVKWYYYLIDRIAVREAVINSATNLARGGYEYFPGDGNYLFTITQSVENTTGAPVSLRPYGQVRRHDQPESRAFFILHEGVVRMSDGELEEIGYDDMPDLAEGEQRIDVAEDGWIGFTDKYWMTTLIPQPGTPFRSVAREVGGVYLTETVLEPVTVAAGETAQAQSLLFAGAKEWETIRAYEQAGVDRFVDSIDWGWFFFLTKPIFQLLHWLNAAIGNMGWAIIVLTLVIKAILFPLSYKSYSSMAKMKELQPEMEKLKERAGDDREQLQKGMMELYKKNKVNPASGCLPILLQIPIFFSLYKVIFVTLELRHAPWLGWIRDLSAPDPSSILNLFGLLPWSTPDPGSIFFILSLGVLPILLGISMWLQQKLNPAPPDPTQRMIFAWMPWVFMFMLGSFASGLVLYWIANNTITFLQQYAIMRSHGYRPDILGNILGSGKSDEKK